MSLGSRRGLDNAYGSGYDFLVVLYYLWFEEKLEKSEIAERLGIENISVHTQLYNFSWHYSNNFEENQTAFFQEKRKNDLVLKTAKKEAPSLKPNEHPRLKQALTYAQKTQRRTYENYGFSSAEEYIQVLYYLRFISGLSAKEIMPLFRIQYRTLQGHLKRFGLNVSVREGVTEKKERGSQNYITTNLSKRKTTAKAQRKNYSTGSKNEIYARKQLSNFLYDYIQYDKYEVVVGLSNIGILGSLEIDIPVMVYDIVNKRLFRFAIEYNGDYYHTEKRDKNKISVAKRKGWRYLAIVEDTNHQYSNRTDLLDQRIRELCQEIKDIVTKKPSQA